jgi:hypothetical protein
MHILGGPEKKDALLFFATAKLLVLQDSDLCRRYAEANRIKLLLREKMGAQ